MVSTGTQVTSSSSSSSSTSLTKWTYDVFLSFRGEDTRYTFADHLYMALDQQNFRVFRDDVELEKGGVVAPELFKAIKGSRLVIVVFSRNYAHSKCCLDELSEIMDCKKKNRQTVVPIFYHVDPSHIRNQTGSFREAFANYDEDKMEKKEKVQRWRDALTDAGNIAGWHVQKGYEGKLIKEIVDDIFSRLNCKLLHVGDNIVGMNFRLEEIQSLVNTNLNDVRMVGIYGIGGIGKTTITKVVFNKISYQFESVSFLENVKERSKGCLGLLHLQQQLLDDLLRGKNKKILSCVDEGIYVIKDRVHLKRVLVILDDVDQLDQLKSLAGSCEWFGLGSRILITTRNKHLLDVHEVYASYEAKELDYKESIQLFSQNAFKQNLPREEYRHLSNCMVDYAKGLPLALKVLGSFLFKKTIPEWESALHKLKRKPNMEIQNVLKTSFDGLDDMEKEIFLDIACFFKGKSENFVVRILDSCNFHAKIGIRVLSNRCLITLLGGIIEMHDLLQEMGREIVRQECPKEPGNWSRLWEHQDVYHVLTRETGTETMEGIFLNMSTVKDIRLTAHAFKMMKRLRLLKVYNGCSYPFINRDYRIHLPQDFELPSHELRYLHWDVYPLKSLPSNFHGENLVELKLQASDIEQLWEENKGLEKLKVIDLSNSQQLIKLSAFSSMPNLEELILETCTGLEEIDESVGVLKKLTFLNLRECEKLRSLPSSIGYLKSLEILDLFGCSNFAKFPEIKGNAECLWWLVLSGTAIKELPSSIDHLSRLEKLDLCNCKDLGSLPTSICRLKSLEDFNLNGCSKLEAFPEIMKDIEHAPMLDLGGRAIKEPPSSIEHLSNLVSMGLSSHRNITRSVHYSDIIGLQFHSYAALCSLAHLDLSDCNLKEDAIPNDIWCLSSLEYLNLSGNDMCCIPVGITKLSNLRVLNLSHCRNLQELQELPSSIQNMDAHGCTSLETSSSLLRSCLLQYFKSIIQDFECGRGPSEIDYWRGINLIIPGSQGIPKWISQEYVGSDQLIELPMNWYEDSDFLGFALCLFYDKDFSHHHDPCKLTCILTFHGDEFEFVNRYWFDSRCDLCYWEGVSDHVVVMYCPKIVIRTKYHSNQWRHLKASFYGVNFKNCVVHFIHAEDHQDNCIPHLLDLLGNFGDNGSAVEHYNDNVERILDNEEGNPAKGLHHERLRAPNIDLKL